MVNFVLNISSATVGSTYVASEIEASRVAVYKKLKLTNLQTANTRLLLTSNQHTASTCSQGWSPS